MPSRSLVLITETSPLFSDDPESVLVFPQDEEKQKQNYDSL